MITIECLNCGNQLRFEISQFGTDDAKMKIEPCKCPVEKACGECNKNHTEKLAEANKKYDDLFGDLKGLVHDYEE